MAGTDKAIQAKLKRKRMNVKAARDVLDYSGKHWVEFAKSDIEVSNFDPARIVREVVETGSFKADVSKMDRLEISSCAVSKLASSFSAGRKFYWKAYGVVRMLACEFLPVGFQYVLYNRGQEGDAWVKTDADLMEKIEAK